MDYDRLAQEIHDNARAKGFWDKERDMDEMLMLAVSELAEGLEEHRDGKPLIYFKHNHTGCPKAGVESLVRGECNPKPEGLAIELADFIIRCLDTLQSLRNVPGDSYMDASGGLMQVSTMVTVAGVLVHREMPKLESAKLFNITRITCRAIDDLGGIHRLHLARACREAVDWLTELTGDAEVPIGIKMDYNKTRERLHGKAY